MAAALPVLAVLLTAAVLAVASVIAQLRCVDAAREAALLAARGDSGAATAAARLAPAGARVSIHRDGSLVRVRVEAQLRPLRGLPGLAVGATSVAETEPGSEP